MIDPPTIIRTQTQLTAIIHVTVAREAMPSVIGPGIRELLKGIAAQGVAPVGPWFTHHLRRPTDTFDFQISVPVGAVVTSAGRMRPSVWPAMTLARTVYPGPYEGLGGAWGEFLKWIEASGHPQAEDLWECYLVGPDASPDPSRWRTQLNRPLAHGKNPGGRKTAKE